MGSDVPAGKVALQAQGDADGHGSVGVMRAPAGVSWTAEATTCEVAMFVYSQVKQTAGQWQRPWFSRHVYTLVDVDTCMRSERGHRCERGLAAREVAGRGDGGHGRRW